MVCGGSPLIGSVEGRLAQAGMNAIDHRHEPAKEISRRHQIGQEEDTTGLGDVVGVLPLGHLLGNGRILLFVGGFLEDHLVRLSRYFQNFECCSTSCCSVTGSLLRSRKSSSVFLCRM